MSQRSATARLCPPRGRAAHAVSARDPHPDGAHPPCVVRRGRRPPASQHMPWRPLSVLASLPLPRRRRRHYYDFPAVPWLGTGRGEAARRPAAREVSIARRARVPEGEKVGRGWPWETEPLPGFTTGSGTSAPTGAGGRPAEGTGAGRQGRRTATHWHTVPRTGPNAARIAARSRRPPEGPACRPAAPRRHQVPTEAPSTHRTDPVLYHEDCLRVCPARGGGGGPERRCVGGTAWPARAGGRGRVRAARRVKGGPGALASRWDAATPMRGGGGGPPPFPAQPGGQAGASDGQALLRGRGWRPSLPPAHTPTSLPRVPLTPRSPQTPCPQPLPTAPSPVRQGGGHRD